MVNLTRVTSYFIAALIFIPMRGNDANHIFIHLLATCISSDDKSLFRPFADSLTQLPVFIVVNSIVSNIPWTTEVRERHFFIAGCLYHN